MKLTRHQRNELMETIAHLCVGLSIFMKGIDKFEHHHTLISLMLVLAGLMVIVFSIYNKKIESTLGQIKYYIFGIEGIVMALIGYSYFKDGYHLLHYAYYVVSVLFFIAIPVTYFLHKSRKKKEASKTDLNDSKNNGIVNSIASQEEKI
jgi:predicted MFS family arabinose efflux permease